MIEESGKGISAVTVGSARGDLKRTSTAKKLERELREYLSGKRRSFSKFPLEMRALNPFTRKVLTAVSRIPYGETRSYSDIARAVRAERAVRAVGTAVGKNPFLVVVPCHRVIAKDGGIGGYSAGLSLKKTLLALESVSRCDQEV